MQVNITLHTCIVMSSDRWGLRASKLFNQTAGFNRKWM